MKGDKRIEMKKQETIILKPGVNQNYQVKPDSLLKPTQVYKLKKQFMFKPLKSV